MTQEIKFLFFVPGPLRGVAGASQLHSGCLDANWVPISVSLNMTQYSLVWQTLHEFYFMKVQILNDAFNLF